MAHQAGAYPGFLSIKRLVFLLPPNSMLVHRKVNLSSKFAGTHIYTLIERGTMKAQEHKAVLQPRLEPGLLDPKSPDSWQDLQIFVRIVLFEIGLQRIDTLLFLQYINKMRNRSKVVAVVVRQQVYGENNLI